MSFCSPTMVKTSLRLISAYSETQEKYEKKKMTEQLKPLPGASIVDVGVQFESGDRISKTCGAKGWFVGFSTTKMVGCLMVSRGLSLGPFSLKNRAPVGSLRVNVRQIGSALNHVCNPLKPTVLVLQQGVLDLQGFYCDKSQSQRCGYALEILLDLVKLKTRKKTK
nr:hypothetical protein Itr_chr10CG19980 [Ipomoea trifida]